VGPLHGVRVVDFSMVVAGPFCAQILADLGADVVKIEPPRGDTSRLLGPPFRDGITPLFAHFNRNKRSLALDLQQEAGSAAARRLSRDADVLVHNFRPGVAERLGIGYEALAADNPRLVYVAVSGFGPDGPYADQPAYDMVIQALSGFMSIQGDGSAPRLVRGLVADKSTGMTAAWGALAALFARERSGGRGQRVDVPMLDAFSAFMLPDVLSDDTFLPQGGAPAPRLDGVYRAWETADGHVVLLVIEDRQFEAMCRVLDREDMHANPRYAGLLQRIAHAPELFALLEQELRKWTTADLVERARRFGVPLAPVHDIAGFLADPQVVASGTVFEAEDGAAGRLRLLRSPVRFAATPSRFARRPPRLGEHSDEVLRERGFTAAEIAVLRSAGAVAG
jgi:crotonobetainyl-CoA:carnitine CoA-transferase CaiB-like acyl-CoA transferase